jgi:hypothetical protein
LKRYVADEGVSPVGILAGNSATELIVFEPWQEAGGKIIVDGREEGEDIVSTSHKLN